MRDVDTALARFIGAAYADFRRAARCATPGAPLRWRLLARLGRLRPATAWCRGSSAAAAAGKHLVDVVRIVCVAADLVVVGQFLARLDGRGCASMNTRRFSMTDSQFGSQE